MFLDLYTTHSKSTANKSHYPPAKESARKIAALFPGSSVTVAIVNGVVFSFFQTQPTEIGPELLLNRIREITPARLIARSYNDKKASETSLRELFLTPALALREASFKGFENLTPSFMAEFAKARPNLSRLDLRATKNCYALLQAFLASLQEEEAAADHIVIRVGGSDLTPEQKRELNLRYPHATLEDLDERALPHSIKIERKPHPPTLEEIEAVLRRSNEESVEVDLWELTNLTAFDLLYLEMTFPRMRFNFVDPPSCTLPLFDRSIIERVCCRFPSIEMRLTCTTSKDEKQLLGMLDAFPNVKFLNDARVTHLLEDVDLLKGHLKRSLRRGITTTLSNNELSTLAERAPSLEPLIGKILAYRNNSGARFLYSMLKEIESLTFETAPAGRLQPDPQLSRSLSALLIGPAVVLDPLTDQTPFHLAVEKGDLNRVELLLEDGADVNAAGPLGKLPLHLAAERGYEEIAKLLIARGANPDALSRNDFQPIHFAARNGHEKVVNLLLAHGAKVDAVGGRANQPLHLAAVMGREKVIELLLASGAKVDARNSHGYQPIHLAARNGFQKAVGLLLAKGAKVDAITDYGDQPIHLAAENGHLEALEVLIAKGAEVGARNSIGDQPLHLAAERGHENVVKLLLENGAKIEAVNNKEDRPLHKAAFRGRKNVVKLLLEKGADVNSVGGFFGKSPLRIVLDLLIAKEADLDEFYAQSKFAQLTALLGHDKAAELLAQREKEDAVGFMRREPLRFADKEEYEKVAELLIANGANIAAVNNCGDRPLDTAALIKHEKVLELLIANGTLKEAEIFLGAHPLHAAAERGYEKVVEILIAKGAKVDAIDGHGDQPIHLAARFGFKKAVELLLTKGAKVDAKNGLGDQPIHLAAENGHLDVLKDLLAKGAKVDAANTLGNLPIDLAARKGYKEVIELLLAKGAKS